MNIKLKQDTRGQATILALVFMTVLCGMVALVLDVGSWYRADRALQSTADASALAGAQALPYDTGKAASLAVEYANKNGGGLAGAGVAFSGKLVANDTIAVRIERPAPGFFAKLFGIDSVTVGANASARAGHISSAQWVAPIVVDEKHPLISGSGCPCFGVDTELRLHHLHKPGSSNAAGAFGLVNLDQNAPGNIGAEVLGEWILNGFERYMELGKYRSSPGTEFNSSHIQNALAERMGDELLFPVYRTIEGSGQNAKYEIVAWIGFGLTGKQIQGDQGRLYGSFTRVVWRGIQSDYAYDPDLGVRSIALVE